jgi:molecular chaperone DnaK (HSP70)
MIQGLGKFPEGNQIIVHFTLNLNGMLEVTATEKRTGLQKTVEFDTDAEDEEIGVESLSARVEALTNAGETGSPGDENENSGKPASGRLADLKTRCKVMLDQDGLEDDDREDLHNGLESIESALNDEDAEAAEEAMDELENILFFLEN